MDSEELKNSDGVLIKGPLIIKPKVHADERGYFFESWNQSSFNEIVNKKIIFKQDNQSFSKSGVVRGLHYQLRPFIQSKLVKVVSGKIFDVIVDLRENSDTFSNWLGIIIDDTNNYQLWVPEGFAHGFLTISKTAIVQYKVTNYWSSNHEVTLNWNDPIININWPELNLKNKIMISKKDRMGKSLQNLIDYKLTF